MADTVQLRFTKTGLQTTVQDLGRHGYRDIGIPVNGAMDKASAKMANQLVGNPEDAPVLEITLIGPAIEVTGDVQMAITGADLSPMLNGISVEMYETLELTTEDVLSFGRPVEGCRTYLAVRGQWQIRSWLGSVSAAAGKTTAMTPDSYIQKDQVIEIESKDFIETRSIEEDERPDLSKLKEVRVLPGPEFSKLNNLSIGDFFSKDFRISNDSNRMGYKLEGSLSHFDSSQEVISSGIIPGTIQLTNAGQPIILMADAQTSGGYTRIANVVTEDMDKLAQMKPGDMVRFRLVV